MTKIVVNTIRSQTGVTSVTFHDAVTANGKKQWLDRFGIIKANSTEINENVTIPSGTNGLTVGTCLLYTSPSPRDATLSRMPSSA